MKIYFGFTMRGDRKKLQQVKGLFDLLKKQGHVILTEHVVDENFEEIESNFQDETIYERDMKWLEEADVILTEVSGSSFGIGFEIGYTLAGTEKRVYMFYDADLKDKISRMATGNTHPNCVRVPYRDIAEIRNYLQINF